MKELKDIVIDGLSFQLIQMHPLKALLLDKRVVALFLPMLGSIENFNSEISMGEIIINLSDSLAKMKDEDFEKFVVDMCASVIYKGPPPCELSIETINKIFKGKIFTIYKLLFEIMKFNNFSPFELMGVGGLTMETLISNMATNLGKKPGIKLEKSEN